MPGWKQTRSTSTSRSDWKERTVFDWKGQVYPLLGLALFVEARSEADEPLRVESAIKHVPKLPQQRHGVRARNHRYREPLRIEIRGPDGAIPTGCVKITVRYDTTRMKFLGPLDPIALDPATTTVCFPRPDRAGPRVSGSPVCGERVGMDGVRWSPGRERFTEEVVANGYSYALPESLCAALAAYSSAYVREDVPALVESFGAPPPRIARRIDAFLSDVEVHCYHSDFAVQEAPSDRGRFHVWTRIVFLDGNSLTEGVVGSTWAGDENGWRPFSSRR